MNSRQQAGLIALCPAVRWGVNMAAYSTFRTGGKVEALVELSEAAALTALLRWLHQEQLPWQVIGGGSNILFTSTMHEGVFIRLRSPADGIRLETRRATDDGSRSRQVRAHAGCSLAALLTWCMRHHLGGLECMAGIPGSVGGAIRMNAGAFGQEIGPLLDLIECVNERGDVVQLSGKEAVFGYRSTLLPGEPEEKLLILSGIIRLHDADGQEVAARCQEIVNQRKKQQPQGFGSAGSFFKNPKGDFAGRLIEAAGLKGLRHGKAMVSSEHANFIVNTGGASPEDILDLMREVQQKVLQHAGVALEPEVRMY